MQGGRLVEVTEDGVGPAEAVNSGVVLPGVAVVAGKAGITYNIFRTILSDVKE